MSSIAVSLEEGKVELYIMYVREWEGLDGRAFFYALGIDI